MSEKTSIADAYLSIIPSLDGAQQEITSGITSLLTGTSGAATEVGTAAGAAMGTGLLAKVKSVLAPAAVLAAVTGVGTGLYSIGETFDDVTDTIRVGTGATGDALNSLVDVAKNVGSEIPAEWGEIGQTVADVNTRLGLSGDTLQTVSEQFLEAGRILGEDVDINTTTAALSAFGIEGDNVSGALDTMFEVAQATGVSFNDLSSTVQGNASAMQNLGFSFDETTSLVGALDKAGIDSSSTLSAMSKGLVSLAKDGEEPQEAFRRVTEQIDEMVKAGDTAGAIDLASGIFGTRAASKFVGAVQSGTLELDNLVDAVGASSDTILGTAEDTEDFAEKWQEVKNNAQLALEPLGSAVFSTLGDLLAQAVEPMQEISSWAQENPALVQAVVTAVTALTVAFGVLTAAQWAWNTAAAANPTTWIILGIAALVAAVVSLATNWDTVTAWVSSTWTAFTTWLGQSAQSLADWWNGLWSSVGAWWSSQWQSIATAATTIWTSISSTASSIWNGVVSFFTGIPGRIRSGLSSLSNLVSSVGGWFGRAKDAAVSKFNELVSWVGGIPSRIVSALGNVSSLLADAGRQIISGLWDGLKSKFEDVQNWVGGIGSWIADHKGPKRYDLGLLVPNGGWIMQGLDKGLEAEFHSRVLGTVGSFGPRLADELQAATRTNMTALSASSPAPISTASAFPESLILRIGDRDFNAMVDQRADSRIVTAAQIMAGQA
jgi:TP901 family phage tail tape measure protein